MRYCIPSWSLTRSWTRMTNLLSRCDIQTPTYIKMETNAAEASYPRPCSCPRIEAPETWSAPVTHLRRLECASPLMPEPPRPTTTLSQG